MMYKKRLQVIQKTKHMEHKLSLPWETSKHSKFGCAVPIPQKISKIAAHAS